MMNVEVCLKTVGKDATTSKFELRVDANETVGAIKEKIAASQLIAFPEHSLMFQGEKMAVDKALSTYGVKESSSLDFVVEASEESIMKQLAGQKQYHLALAVYVILCIICVVVCLAAMMVGIMGWTFGAVEAVGLIVFVGYSITYSLHIAHNYKSIVIEKGFDVVTLRSSESHDSAAAPATAAQRAGGGTAKTG